jgi:cell division protein ZapA
MGQIAITMNGRVYHLACEGGDEQRLAMIGNHIQATLDRLVSDFGQIGESRLLLMAAATIVRSRRRLRRGLGRSGRRKR